MPVMFRSSSSAPPNSGPLPAVDSSPSVGACYTSSGRLLFRSLASRRRAWPMMSARAPRSWIARDRRGAPPPARAPGRVCADLHARLEQSARTRSHSNWSRKDISAPRTASSGVATARTHAGLCASRRRTLRASRACGCSIRMTSTLAQRQSPCTCAPAATCADQPARVLGRAGLYARPKQRDAHALARRRKYRERSPVCVLRAAHPGVAAASASGSFTAAAREGLMSEFKRTPRRPRPQHPA